MKILNENKNVNLSLIKVALLVFIPAILLMLSYIILGYVQQSIPSILLFYILTIFILFPIELAVIIYASKKEFGSFSVKSALVNQKKISWIKTLVYGILLFGVSGIVLATVGAFETKLTMPISNKLAEIIPVYFDWNNMDFIRQFSKNILLLTCIVYGIFNVIIGPIVEELYFRGYLTSKISRFGKWSPVIITVLFSLYHLWLPLQNIFRICVFLTAAYIAWKEKNIYISIVFHCLCNLFSTISFIVALFAV